MTTGTRRGGWMPRRRIRRGLSGTAAAVAAMAALTASGAPGLLPEEQPAAADGPAAVRTPAAPPHDDSYHTELPPLSSPVPSAAPRPDGGVPPAVRASAQSGIPSTVLAAYRRAEAAIARTDPGCRLSWQLLAAIGKVESGQARGGRVNADGTTLTPILGPVLDGNGFARITDTDGGAHDGDRTYDRAVGPMQFIPSTWARWGADGNGDGRRDPHNMYDAALAAGHYLCAGPRSLTVKAHLDQAVLSYNRSDAYLRTVLSWLDFYRRGVHGVPDGTGVLPAGPGAGGGTPAARPVGGGTGGGGGGGAPRPGTGGGVVVGPRPSGRPTLLPRPPARPRPSTSTPGSPSPTAPSPDPSETAPGPGPTDPAPGPTDPGPTCPAPSPTRTPPAGTSPADPGAPDGDGPCPSPPSPSPSPTPSATLSPSATVPASATSGSDTPSGG
ncbi:lytic murein transglycosylase [Streptomyces sp. SP18CS02]|uniref:lytic murein transglycosylase n=1 Tax=Streptomyces sp. SP18CS02 TaxID=3002531 RepID=UPI002E78A759|nr:lytic murein transglycosylase [Streptomyces sp. SP18CS02]MEE1754034.1 lytic murein transglycosylase [Streptomyces sp. SP18CS02]